MADKLTSITVYTGTKSDNINNANMIPSLLRRRSITARRSGRGGCTLSASTTTGRSGKRRTTK
jgi:hypothetical protein